jgi:hypothetical protein
VKNFSPPLAGLVTTPVRHTGRKAAENLVVQGMSHPMVIEVAIN